MAPLQKPAIYSIYNLQLTIIQWGVEILPKNIIDLSITKKQQNMYNHWILKIYFTHLEEKEI